MSYMKEQWGYNDEQWDDLDLDTPEPMRPIRMQYVTLATERALIADTLDRLGLVYVELHGQIYALSDADSIRISIDAVEQLQSEGIAEPDELQTQRRVERLLIALVLETAGTVERSTLRDPLFLQKLAQEWRAEADQILAARGVAIRASTMQTIAEHEAA